MPRRRSRSIPRATAARPPTDTRARTSGTTTSLRLPACSIPQTKSVIRPGRSSRTYTRSGGSTPRMLNGRHQSSKVEQLGVEVVVANRVDGRARHLAPARQELKARLLEEPLHEHRRVVALHVPARVAPPAVARLRREHLDHGACQGARHQVLRALLAAPAEERVAHLR